MTVVANYKAPMSENQRAHRNNTDSRDNVLPLVKALRVRHFTKFSLIKKEKI